MKAILEHYSRELPTSFYSSGPQTTFRFSCKDGDRYIPMTIDVHCGRNIEFDPDSEYEVVLEIKEIPKRKTKIHEFK